MQISGSLEEKKALSPREERSAEAGKAQHVRRGSVGLALPMLLTSATSWDCCEASTGSYL